jgi:hypothetical protein
LFEKGNETVHHDEFNVRRRERTWGIVRHGPE